MTDHVYVRGTRTTYDNGAPALLVHSIHRDKHHAESWREGEQVVECWALADTVIGAVIHGKNTELSALSSRSRSRRRTTAVLLSRLLWRTSDDR